MANSYNELMGIGSHSEDANLEGWWLLQDDAASTTVDDQSSNSSDGTLEGGDNTSDISTTGPNSYLTKSLDLDGSADTINFGSTAIGTSNYTLLARHRADAAGASTYRDIFRLREAAVTELIVRWDNDNKVRFYETRAAGGGVQDIISASAQTHDQWYTIGASRNGTTNYLYIDGAEEGTDTNSSANNLTTRTLYGGSSEGSGEYFDGKLAELVRFSRNLTATEHAQWDAGPELNYVSGVSFSDAGVYDIGTWALPSPFASGSNGTATHEVIAVKADGTVLDSATTATGTLNLSANAGSVCYLLVRESNTGGYDIGDHGSRTSSYGSANDGYYELASVTAAAGGTTRRYSLTLMGVG